MRVLRVILSVALLMLFSASASASWISYKKHNNVVYFLYDTPSLIKRYHLNSEAFLSDLTFPGGNTATAFHVDQDGIYLALGRNLSRYDLNGNNRRNLINTSSDIREVFTSPTVVYAQDGSNLTSVNKQNNQRVASEDYFYTMTGLSFSESKQRVFGRSNGISPSDILYIDLPIDGSLLSSWQGQKDSPYHGDFPSATNTFLHEDETRVIDNAGIIYSASDLTYQGSLGGAFDDLDFYGNLPVVLRGSDLVVFDAANLEAGTTSYPSAQDVTNIAVNGDFVFGFYEDASGNLSVVKTSLDQLDLPELGEPVDPVGLEYSPDHMLVGNDGIIYILSASNLSIFRWSIAAQRYLSTIPLRDIPKYLAYSSQNQELYTAYANGLISKIPLTGELVEQGIVNLPSEPRGLATAGQYIFAVDDSGAWLSHWTFSASGQQISQEEWNYASREFIWSSANRRFYHFRDSTSPNDLHWEEIGLDGVIGAMGDSPYHSSTGIRYPIRVAPDGSVVILGSGRIYDGLSLAQINNLSNNIEDAAWLGADLFTYKLDGDNTKRQRWNVSNNYDLEEELEISGLPIRLFTVAFDSSNWLIDVTDVNGVPTFSALRVGAATDYDDDGIENTQDNCPYVANPDQEDFDDNQVGDVCESDTDGDGVKDDRDNCVTVANPEQTDVNDNEIGDVCDPQIQGDNLLLDIVPMLAQLARRNQVLPPQWGVLNGLCCTTSSTTFTLTIDGVTRQSVLSSCSADPTLQPLVESVSGVKSASGGLTSAGCGSVAFDFDTEFIDSTNHIFAVDLVQGEVSVVELNQDRSAKSKLNDRSLKSGAPLDAETKRSEPAEKQLKGVFKRVD